MSGLVLKGNLMLNRKVNGVYQGFLGPLNSPEITITAGAGKPINRKSYKRDSFGQNLDTVVSPDVSEFTIKLDDADQETLNLLFLGTLSAVNIAAAAVSAEVMVINHDRWGKLAHRDVSAVVVKDTTAVTTYTEGTDYELDLVGGFVMPLSTGTMVDLENAKINYSHAAASGFKIDAGTDAEVRCWVVIDGINMANQKKVDVNIYEAVLIPEGATPLGGKEQFWEGTLKGQLVKLADKSGIFSYRELN